MPIPKYTPHNAPPYTPPYAPPVGQEVNETTIRGDYAYSTSLGAQQTDVELQKPKISYQPPRVSETIYEPPQGPPPGKT